MFRITFLSTTTRCLGNLTGRSLPRKLRIIPQKNIKINPKIKPKTISHVYWEEIEYYDKFLNPFFAA